MFLSESPLGTTAPTLAPNPQPLHPTLSLLPQHPSRPGAPPSLRVSPSPTTTSRHLGPMATTEPGRPWQNRCMLAEAARGWWSGRCVRGRRFRKARRPEQQEQGPRGGSWFGSTSSLSPLSHHSRLPFVSWMRPSDAGAPRGVESRGRMQAGAAKARSWRWFRFWVQPTKTQSIELWWQHLGASQAQPASLKEMRLPIKFISSNAKI